MATLPFHDGNIHHLLESRLINFPYGVDRRLQMHSSLIRRLSQERELEAHQGCVNAVAWNSKGSLLISGSDDSQINIWSYSGRKLLHSIDTGHSGNIFCVKFIPETSDELVVSGAGDSQVRLFNLSRLSGRECEDGAISPSAVYQCHTKRVKKLAVEVGNPNVVWSASEDGTLRQHDFREGTSCPPAGSAHRECRNILLDLRGGGKRSLADPPKHTLALKSCDISSTRPHLLLVGGNDAFARLYDRRMLPPLTSSGKRMSPPPCVNYFCPMHLSDRISQMQLTHVTFSPSGEEVLLSYSGEHVYLMDVDCASGSAMKYTSGNNLKLLCFTPVLNGVEDQRSVSGVVQNGFERRSVNAARLQLEKCVMLVEIAKKSLEEGKDHFYAIEACNEVLERYGSDVGPTLMHECLCTRAALLLKRNWKNDAHMAIRDCYNARRIDGSSVRAHYYMSEALEQLDKLKEALEFAMAAHCLAPSDNMVAEKVESIKNKIAAEEAEKSNNRSEPRFEPQTRRVLSLSEILHHSEPNNDASQDGPRFEREDSDYDDEVEFNFETQMSDDEGRDVESNMLHGGLNLRIHRSSNGLCELPSTSSQNDKSSYQPEAVIDMKRRFVGHRNVGTDIKQASFLGQRGEYVASGSDDGRWFIWEKQTGRLIKMLHGDEAVVNCVQCHPFDCVVATSGIDSTIKIWTPTASIPSIVAGGSAGPETADVLKAMEDNQKRMQFNRRAIFAHELLEQIQMHEGSLHPFECVQS